MITEKQVTTIIKRQVRNIKKKGPENVPMTLVQFIKKKQTCEGFCFGRTCFDTVEIKNLYHIISAMSPDCKTPPGREKARELPTRMVASLGWVLTWVEPQWGVAGHQSGSGRLAAEVRRGAHCAFALGTLALHRRSSLAQRMGRMRSSQPWAAGRGPAAQWHSAVDLVFGFPR